MAKVISSNEFVNEVENTKGVVVGQICLLLGVHRAKC